MMSISWLTSATSCPTKVCCKCKIEKDVIKFGTRKNTGDGLSYSCKECQAIKNRAYSHTDKRRKYLRDLHQRRYHTDAKYREHWLELNHKTRAKNTARARTRSKTGYLNKRDGIKKDACEKCGSKNRLEMHHSDYSKPSSVLTLCIKCHRFTHSQHKEAYAQ